MTPAEGLLIENGLENPSGDDLEPAPTVQPVHAETAMVEGEHAIQAQLFTKNNQGRIREIHWDIPVLLHQVHGARHGRTGNRHKGDGTPADKIGATSGAVP